MIIIKKIINNIFNIIFIPKLLFDFFSNISLIKNKKKIFIHDSGGFGHNFLFLDLIRMTNIKDDYLYIQFFEKKRHNNYLPLIFNINFLLLNYEIDLHLFKKTFFFGKTENTNEVLLIGTLKFLIKLTNFNNKIVTINQFYDDLIYGFNFKKYKSLISPYSIKQFKSLKISKGLILHQYYFDLLIKNKKALSNEYFSNYYSNLTDLIFKKKDRNLTFYIRFKGKELKEDLYRNGSSPSVYINILKYLIHKGFQISLIGDWEVIKDIKFKKFINLNKNIMNYKKSNCEKNLFDILCLLNTNYFIGEHGGAQYFANYIEKSIIINAFPIGQKLSEISMLYKKIYDKSKNIYIEDTYQYRYIYDFNDNIELKSLNTDEIIKFIESNLI